MVLSIVSYLFIQNISTSNFVELLPLLGIYLAAAFRILPSINIIISQSQYLNFAKPVIKNLKRIFENDLIKIEDIPTTNILFKKDIKLRNIHYQYPNKNIVFSNLNFELKKMSQLGLWEKVVLEKLLL